MTKHPLQIAQEQSERSLSNLNSVRSAYQRGEHSEYLRGHLESLRRERNAAQPNPEPATERTDGSGEESRPTSGREAVSRNVDGEGRQPGLETQPGGNESLPAEND